MPAVTPAPDRVAPPRASAPAGEHAAAPPKVAFLGDSIRQARSLMSDIKTICGHAGVRELARRVVSLESDANRARHMGDVLGRLRGYDWNRSTSELRKEVTVGIPQLMGRMQSFRGLNHDAKHQRHGQGPQVTARQQLRQGDPVDEVHHQVGSVPVLPHVDHAHHVRVA